MEIIDVVGGLVKLLLGGELWVFTILCRSQSVNSPPCPCFDDHTAANETCWPGLYTIFRSLEINVSISTAGHKYHRRNTVEVATPAEAAASADDYQNWCPIRV